MRIPSQLDRDNLYRTKNRRPRPNESYRKIIRLCLGLVLVLLVMKQAARPTVYQTFFDPSQPTSQKSAVSTNPRKIQNSPNFSGESSPRHYMLGATKITPLERSIANRLIEVLSQTDEQLWLKTLLDWQSGIDSLSIPSSIAILLEELEKIGTGAEKEIEQEEINAWIAALDTLSDSEITSNNESSYSKILAIFETLDVRASSRVIDGSVWRSGDFDGLYSFLLQSSSAPNEAVPVIGVLPLLQQPEIYRNQWVRVAGEVARVEQIQTPDNPYDVDEYWQIWLRPLNGVNRPIVVIVPSIPKSVRDFGSSEDDSIPLELQISGRFLKRLSYRSGLGADLAPVIVGEIRYAPASPEEITQTPTETSEDDSNLFWPLGIALVIGFSLSVIVMWSTGKAAKKSRQLRQSQRDTEIKDFGDFSFEKDQMHYIDESSTG